MLLEEHMHTEKEVYIVTPTNGGEKSLVAIFDDREQAEATADWWRKKGHDCKVVKCQSNTAYVGIDAAGEVIPVDATIDDPETVLPGTIITTGRTPDEAVAKVQRLGQEPKKLDGEITVGTDHLDRPTITFTGVFARAIERNGKACDLPTAPKIKDGSGNAMDSAKANLTGQVGEAAVQVFLHGPVGGWQRYATERGIRNADPYKGDGGVDAITRAGRKVDVKTSRLFQPKARPERLNLVVPPDERHEDTTYIQVWFHRVADDHFVAMIQGYCHEADLPDHLSSTKAIKNKFIVPAHTLADPTHLLEATA